jgi:hypothetical protein
VVVWVAGFLSFGVGLIIAVWSVVYAARRGATWSVGRQTEETAVTPEETTWRRGWSGHYGVGRRWRWSGHYDFGSRTWVWDDGGDGGDDGGDGGGGGGGGDGGGGGCS